jgi:hypothetical protein
MHLAMLLPIQTARIPVIRSQISRPPGILLQKSINAGISFQMPGQKGFKRILGLFIIFTASAV